MEASQNGPEYTHIFARVVREELTYIQRRRKALELPTVPVEQEQQRLTQALNELKESGRDPDEEGAKRDADTPRVDIRASTAAGLVGLALSGGGIRSATFNLGLLQGLVKRDILRYCDYLSTVSGGGYIGSCLSSLLDNPEASGVEDRFPFRFQGGTDPDERKEVKWLRQHSDYLAPDVSLFSLDIWRMIGLYLSGLVLTNATPVAFLCFLAFVIRWVGRNTNTHGLVVGLLALSVSVFVVMVILRWLSTLRNLEMDQRQRRGKQQAGLAALAATLATVAGLIWLAINFPSLKSEADALLKGISVASAVGLVAGLIKSENKLLKSLLPFLFRIAWIALLPILFAWFLRFLTESEMLGYTLLNVPLLILIGIGLAILSVFTNTNRISLHHFYRDRLSEAYVIKRIKKSGTPDETIISNESLSLARLHAQPNGAPYHLINATLNVPDTRDRYLRGRGADFFVFSKFYCGAESTGYRWTDRYENGETRLATAFAVSGAAASPQMGTSTSPILRFFLTLLNIRLNRWMPNPDPQRAPLLEFWPYYFVKELLGKERETDGLLNISDGGHYENLGVYPLIKRGCRYIIASDAAADPNFAMEDLANLLRKMRIDLGVDIEINLNSLRQDPDTKNTPQHHAVGRILYPDGTEGTLVYLKSSLTGQEPEDLLSYRRQHPEFPHETTADQFFDEPQFEAYRKLGELIGREVFFQKGMLVALGQPMPVDVSNTQQLPSTPRPEEKEL